MRADENGKPARNKKFTRGVCALLSFALLAAVPASWGTPFAPEAAAAEMVAPLAAGSVPYAEAFGKVSDPDTSFPDFTLGGKIEEDGRLWTDKTVSADRAVIYDTSGRAVNSVAARPDEFLVTLSALGQSYKDEQIVVEPSDTVFVIDVSNSMYSNFIKDEDGHIETDEDGNQMSRLRAMVASLNSAIQTLMEDPENGNRVAVVAFGGSGVAGQSHITPILRLGRYNVSDGKYFFLKSSAIIGVSGEIPSSSLINPASRTIKAVGGTPTQRGIRAGAQILLDNGDTTYDDGKGHIITRKPNIVLLTDGEPTLGWDDYTFSKPTSDTDTGSTSGNANIVNMGIEVMTVLTASHFKQQVSEHYYGAEAASKSAGFYNIGLGVADSPDAHAVLDPMGDQTGSGKTNAALISDSRSGTIYNMKELLDRFVTPGQGTITFPTLPKGLGSGRDFVTVSNIGGELKSYDYADLYVATADKMEDIENAFDNITQQITSQGSYLTDVDEEGASTGDGYVVFSDVIGEHMEVKGVNGLWFQNRLYSGVNFARGINTGGTIRQEFTDALGERLKNDEIGNISNSIDADALIKSNISGGALYYKSESDFGNKIKYYADNNRIYRGSYYNADGSEAAIPPGATCAVELYTMRGDARDPISGDPINMMDVVFQVITALDGGDFSFVTSKGDAMPHHLEKGQQMVRWYIPASHIPLRTVSERKDNEGSPIYGADGQTVMVHLSDTVPIRYIYSVGLKDSVSLPGDDKVPGKDAYYFYTNQWSGSGKGINDTSVYFEPNRENTYYYKTGETTPTGSDKTDKGKESNPTGTSDITTTIGAGVGNTVRQRWLGNNGRVEMPFTKLTVTKEWEILLNTAIKPEYVQLYDGGGKPVGEPKQITPPGISGREPIDENGVLTKVSASAEWTGLPVFATGAGGNAEFIPYTVKEGSYNTATKVFTPYGGGEGFSIDYVQPEWNTADRTMNGAVITNRSEDVKRWFLVIDKRFEGVDPSIGGGKIDFEIHVSTAGDENFYMPVSFDALGDKTLTYPDDFTNGRYETALVAGGSSAATAYLGDLDFLIVEKSHSVDGYTGLAPLVSGAEPFEKRQPDPGSETVTPYYPSFGAGDQAFRVSDVKLQGTASIVLTNRYKSDSLPKLALEKIFDGAIDKTDDHDITFVIEGWESKDAADANDLSKRIFYDTTHCHMLIQNGPSVSIPVDNALEQAFASNPSNQIKYPGYTAVTHPTELTEGYYTITELGAENVLDNDDPDAEFDSAFAAAITDRDGTAPTFERTPGENKIGFQLSNGDDVTVSLTNTYTRKTQLVLEKTFSGIEEELFGASGTYFTVTGTNYEEVVYIDEFDYDDATGTYRYVINGLDTGQYTVTETSGDVGIKALYDPPTITATDGQTSSGNGTITTSLGADKTTTVKFKNIYVKKPVPDPAKLTIKKTFSGNIPPDLPDDISFAVVGKNAGGQIIFQKNIPFPSDFSSNASGWTLNNSEYTFALTDNLQPGTYQITESGGQAAGYTLTVAPSDGYTLLMDYGDEMTVAFTNTYAAAPPKRLTIKKELGDNAAAWNATESTQFDVRVKDTGGNYLIFNSGVYSSTITDVTSATKLTISKNTPVTVTGLPAGGGYTVEETIPSTEHYKPEYSQSESGNEITVTVKNNYPKPGGRLTIEKALASNYADWNITDNTAFPVRVKDATANNYLTFDSRNNVTGGSAAGTELMISQNASVTVYGLDKSHTYTVEEVRPDGTDSIYSVVYDSSDVSFQNSDDVTVKVTNTYQSVSGNSSLIITKTLAGSYADWGVSNSTEFNVKVYDETNKNYLLFVEVSTIRARLSGKFYKCVGNDTQGISDLTPSENTVIYDTLPITAEAPVTLLNLWTYQNTETVYRVEEVQAPFSDKIDGGLPSQSVTLTNSVNAKIVITNNYTSGSGNLIIAKTLHGSPQDWGADADTLFSASVRAVDGKNSGKYLVFANNSFSGEYSTTRSFVSFSQNAPATLVGLPTGRYAVEEEPPANCDVTYSGDVVVENGQNVVSLAYNGANRTVTVENTYDKGEGIITLKKALSGYAGDWGASNATPFNAIIYEEYQDNGATVKNRLYFVKAEDGANAYLCAGIEGNMDPAYTNRPKLGTVPFSVNSPATLAGLWTDNGRRYTVEEVSDGSNFTAGYAYSSQTLTADGNITVTVTNTYKNRPDFGTLIVAKHLEGNSTDWGATSKTVYGAMVRDGENKYIKFERDTSASGYSYTAAEEPPADSLPPPSDRTYKDYIVNFTEEQPAIISELDANTSKYTVEELLDGHFTTDYDNDNDSNDANGAGITLYSTSSAAVTVTNIYQPGRTELEIKKELKGQYNGWKVDDNTKFLVMVKCLNDDPNGGVNYIKFPEGRSSNNIYHASGNSVRDGGLPPDVMPTPGYTPAQGAPAYDYGQYLIEITSGQAVTVTGLWPGYRYAVVELPSNGAEISYTHPDGFWLYEDTKSSVTVTNTYSDPVGSLTVSKTLAGSAADREKWNVGENDEFEIRLKGKMLSDSDFYYLSFDGGNNYDGDATRYNADGTPLTVSASSPVTVHGLPSGMVCAVEEAAAYGDPEVGYAYKDDSATTYNSASATIGIGEAGAMAEAKVTNTYLPVEGDLSIIKVLNGEYESWEADRNTEFKAQIYECGSTVDTGKLLKFNKIRGTDNWYHRLADADEISASVRAFAQISGAMLFSPAPPDVASPDALYAETPDTASPSAVYAETADAASPSALYAETPAAASLAALYEVTPDLASLAALYEETPSVIISPSALALYADEVVDTVTFSAALPATLEGLKYGKFYRVVEVLEDGSEVTEDSSEMPEGGFTASYAGNNGQFTERGGGIGITVTVTNDYRKIDPTGDVIIRFRKKVNGGAPRKRFTFELTPLNSANPYDVQGQSEYDRQYAYGSESGETGQFRPLRFEKAGVYYYRVEELNERDGWTYDPRLQRVTQVQVRKRNGAGVLDAVVSYTDGSPVTFDGVSQVAEFYNEYPTDSPGGPGRPPGGPGRPSTPETPPVPTPPPIVPMIPTPPPTVPGDPGGAPPADGTGLPPGITPGGGSGQSSDGSSQTTGTWGTSNPMITERSPQTGDTAGLPFWAAVLSGFAALAAASLGALLKRIKNR